MGVIDNLGKINQGLTLTNGVVGGVFGILGTILSVIQARKDAGQDVEDFEPAVAELDTLLAQVDLNDAKYREVPELKITPGGPVDAAGGDSPAE